MKMRENFLIRTLDPIILSWHC